MHARPPSDTEPYVVWLTIILVGGLCWLIATAIEVIWLWPAKMQMYSGTYVVSPQGRLLARAAVYFVSVFAYRLALALEWPMRMYARLSVIVVNALLGYLLVRFAIVAMNVSGALIDGRSDVLRDDMGELQVFTVSWNGWLGAARFVLPVYFLGLAAIALVLVSRRFRQNTLSMSRLSLDYANTRIAMLSAQLQPHFLFNSLHAISELINVSPVRATDMIARLGDFLRHALESSKQPWVSVRSEIAGLQAYLAVQHARFRDELEANIDATPDSLALVMPSMLLQPLVENAIEHGRRHGNGPLIVQVQLRRDESRLTVLVSNNRPTLAASVPKSAYGDGLNNVSARLNAAYAGTASLDVGPNPAGGALAVLALPILLAPAIPDGAPHD
jgi:hypothetical protein